MPGRLVVRVGVNYSNEFVCVNSQDTGYCVMAESEASTNTSVSASTSYTNAKKTSSDEETSAESILSRPKSPRMSDMVRKRKVGKNPSPKYRNKVGIIGGISGNNR